MIWAAAAALAAVLAVAALLVGWFRLRRPRRIDSPEAAADAADRDLPGFVTAGAVVGADGTAALAVAQTGRVALIRRRGARLAAREVSWQTIRLIPGGVLVEAQGRGADVAIAGVDALDIRRLGPARFGC